MLRQLCGVPENEEVQVAGLIVLEPPREPKERSFRRLTAEAGDLDVMGTSSAAVYRCLRWTRILPGERYLRRVWQVAASCSRRCRWAGRGGGLETRHFLAITYLFGR